MNIYNTQKNFFNDDVVIYGGLSALSGTTFTDTIFTTTSALSVVNTGVGPALYVSQAAGSYDVASFYDGDGVEVLHVGNAAGGGNPKGKIGINESNPDAELTVNGAISSNDGITVAGGNSTQWNSNYTTTNTNSADWNSAYTNANYTNARGIQSFVFASSAINIAAHLASGTPIYNMFTVPTGYRFAADMLQLTVIDTPGGAGTPTVQLQRATDGQSLAPSLPIPTGAGKFNVYSVANHNSSATIRNTAPPGGVVTLATTVATAYTTLSCIAIIKGSLIPTSLYV